MKYIILSVVIIGLLVWGGFYIFSNKIAVQNQDVSVLSTIPTVQPTTETSEIKSATNTLQNKKENHMVTIDTNYGKIVFQTYDVDSPKTVENFVTLANKGFYDGLTFHRAIKGFMIQGGDPQGNGHGGPGYTIPDEFNSESALYKNGYKKGIVAMANTGLPNSGGSQFFIMTSDYPLPPQYTIFGKVISGQDVVDTIANLKTGLEDKLISPITMKKVMVE